MRSRPMTTTTTALCAVTLSTLALPSLLLLSSVFTTAEGAGNRYSKGDKVELWVNKVRLLLSRMVTTRDRMGRIRTQDRPR